MKSLLASCLILIGVILSCSEPVNTGPDAIKDSFSYDVRKQDTMPDEVFDLLNPYDLKNVDNEIIQDVGSKDGKGQTKDSTGAVSNDNFSLVLSSSKGKVLLYAADVTPNRDIVAVGSAFLTDSKKSAAYIIRVTTQGKIVWQRVLDGKGYDEFKSVIAVKDGMILGGTTSSFGNNEPPWLVKINFDGHVLWQKMVVDPQNKGSYILNRIKRLHDSNDFMVLGGKERLAVKDPSLQYDAIDLWVARISDNGTMVFQKIIGDACYQEAWDFVEEDDGYTVVAQTNGGFNGAWQRECSTINPMNNNPYTWMLRLDKTGGIKHQIIYGSANGLFPVSLIRTDKGYFIAGRASWAHSSYEDEFYDDMMVWSVNRDYTITWSKTLPVADSYQTIIGAESFKDGFLVAASVDTIGAGPSDIMLFKVTGDGEIGFQKLYGKQGEDGLRRILRYGPETILAVGKSDSFLSDTKAHSWLFSIDMNNGKAVSSFVNNTNQKFVEGKIGIYTPKHHEPLSASINLKDTNCKQHGENCVITNDASVTISFNNQ